MSKILRHLPGLQSSLRCFLAILLWFNILDTAFAQGPPTNGTNLPGVIVIPTNAAPAPNIEPSPAPPSVLEGLQEQNPATNQIGAAPVPPAPPGPTGLGSPQPAAPVMGTSAIAGPPGVMGTGLAGPGIPLWGPIDIHPHALYTFSYGNSIEATPGKPANTAIHTVTPGFLLDIGKNWSLDYNPAFAFYSDPAFKDTVDQSVVLYGAWANEEWSLSLLQSYTSSSDPLVETGAQTAQEAYGTSLGASRQLGGQLSLQLGLNQNFRNAETLSDLHEWTGNSWLNYQADSMFGVGLGLVLGYDKIDPGSDMPFEQVQGKINFHPGAKLFMTLSGGVEDRQFTGPSAPSLISPIFSGSVLYQLFEPTSLSLTFNRTVTPSFFANEVEVSTAVNGSLRQGLTKKIFLEADIGYTTTPLTSIVPAPLPQFFFGTPPRTALQEVRNDATTFYRISLMYNIVQQVSFSVYYSLTDNSSGQSSFAYSSRQVGLSLAYRY